MERGVTHWFIERIASWRDRPAFVWDGGQVSHAELAEACREWSGRLSERGVGAGDVVVVEGDHSAASFSLLLALAARGAVVVPLTPQPHEILRARCTTAGASWVIALRDGEAAFERLPQGPQHDLLARLRARHRAGLILFSSGSSGEPKACLLDLDSLFEVTRTPRKGFVTAAFLLFDHIGGINTMINVLGHGGTAVVIGDRRVETVAAAIAAHGVELLPTSPTFLKMLLISDAASRHDLSSLKLITYGTEPMPQSTLEDLHRAFPGVRLKQTYGLSELGIVPTRSRAPGSLWMQIGGEGVEHRIVDGILWVRAPTAMLGYLNAPSPFDSDGWLNTGDRVEVDGDYLKILGRDSELINVGGEKVHPSEVEGVLMAAGNIRDATVSARANPVTGSVVVATVALIEDEDPAALKVRLGQFCRSRLEAHKVPMLFRIAEQDLHSPRFKKIRVKQA
ncbi:MAG TPA: fatty acid--CoA ligase family protein [Thermohalobaculum sp.]|nr:fatty acid--CoA ligase family protein [Thermohalobaculum sp.]